MKKLLEEKGMATAAYATYIKRMEAREMVMQTANGSYKKLIS